MTTEIIVKDLYTDRYIYDMNSNNEVIYKHEVSEAWKFDNINDSQFKEFMKYCRNDYVMLTVIEIIVL